MLIATVAKMKFLLLVIVLIVFASPTLAGYGDVRISGGGDSGRLEFKLSNGTWGTVCSQGFDDDAGDVACKQLGYLRSSDILDSSQFGPVALPASYRLTVTLHNLPTNDPTALGWGLCFWKMYSLEFSLRFIDDSAWPRFVPTNAPVAVCDIYCSGDEDELLDCVLLDLCDGDPFLYQCDHSQDIGVTCTDSLTTVEIVGIVLGALFVIGFTTFMLALFMCCLMPSCPYYYKTRFFNDASTVLVQQPQVLATTATVTTTPQYVKPTGYTTVPPSGFKSVPPPPTTL